MDLSVVVPTLNGRDRLEACLDALADHAPDAEVIVVNGPSADGTTGMIVDRSDVDVLIETAERNVSVARNAGIKAATGDAVSILRYNRLVGPGWAATVRDALSDGADAVTGPTQGARACWPPAGTFNPENVAFRRAVLGALNGFDEALVVGSMRDLWERFDSAGYRARRTASMAVTGAYGTEETFELEPAHRYRSGAYRRCKNGTLDWRRLLRIGLGSLAGTTLGLVRGDTSPTAVGGGLREAAGGFVAGVREGLKARRAADDIDINPHGLDEREDRAVRRYDWRDTPLACANP